MNDEQRMSGTKEGSRSIYLRNATADDEQALQALQARCPMGTTLVVSTVNTPDFYGRARAYPWYRVYVACCDGEIVGSAACALRNGVVGGRVVPVGYEFQYFTSPDCRRLGVARALRRQIEQDLRAQGAHLSYAVIIEGNEPALALFADEGFSVHRTFVMPGVLVYREMNEKSAGKVIRTAMPDDMQQVAALANDTWRGYELYEPASAASLAAFLTRTPAFDAENLLVLAEGDQVVAALGYWDWSQITRLTVHALGLKLRLISGLLDLAGRAWRLPAGVHPGDALKQAVLTPVAYRSATDLSTLVRRVNNLCLARGIGQIFTVAEKGHDVLDGLKGLITLDSDLHVMVKPLAEDAVLQPGPVYLDGRDL